ncbi:MAG: phosphoribosylformylglycinamidine synthase [Bacteroidales bacterium]
MIFFFETASKVIVVGADGDLGASTLDKLIWLFGEAEFVKVKSLEGSYIGPRKEMITPWSTNAVEISENMGIQGINRIEEFFKASKTCSFDSMLQRRYEILDQNIFDIDIKPEPIKDIEDIEEYNISEGLALSEEEIEYLKNVSKELNRPLTDSEVFGFSQVNSEHCRHKIFNGKFIIDGKEKELSLFQLIKKTSTSNHNSIISAYKDNCSFVQGPVVEQLSPQDADKPSYFGIKDIETVLALKAETHNFPTTVEPFNGAATGTGGEIRDRIAGGKGSWPVAGTAVYMTSYARTESGRSFETSTQSRKWLYQSPLDILIKASDGASDFGNKFGQPLICGSVFTFEHVENDKTYGYDKVIMLAGGIGYGRKDYALKSIPQRGNKLLLMGGDNYRIGMGGGAVSSVATGEYDNAIELNAVQRANPEMQKRVFNAIRALCESDDNPIISIHDHGAGGHLNCLSELVEDTGGIITIDNLPIGDPTLSLKEIIGNESQERMGMVVDGKDVERIKNIASRERAHCYEIGEVTGDMNFVFEKKSTGEKPINWKLEHMFGSAPQLRLTDSTTNEKFSALKYDNSKIEQYLNQVLKLESVACKDWLTNKVDRAVTGKIATQQCSGELQLPLNNLGVIALDYRGRAGFATSLGHAPIAALIDAKEGSKLAIAESLTNIVWAPLKNGLQSVSLSANWMWPAKNAGENARLYSAVEGASEFACELGINIPTGKDSMSMTQKYKDDVVYAPGTVIITASGEVTDVKQTITSNLKDIANSKLIYIEFTKSDFELGGSSFAQVINRVGDKLPKITNSEYFMTTFNTLQTLIEDGDILAGHDVSSGGLITTLLEMCFPSSKLGVEIDLTSIRERDTCKILFSEKSGVVIQVSDIETVETKLRKNAVSFYEIGSINKSCRAMIKNYKDKLDLSVAEYRDNWFFTSYLMDKVQSGEKKAKERFDNYKKNILTYDFGDFSGNNVDLGIDFNRRTESIVKVAIIREKGVNGDREMAYAMYLAGMDVKDVHMTDLISGRETLEDVNMIVFVGGFSNSDVLGSAKGWAGAFKYNDKARKALENFYARKDTVSLGVCNGCQLMIELNLINPTHEKRTQMLHNESGKFESGFVNVTISKSNSVLLNGMQGNRLGIWIQHGEGKFSLPMGRANYNIAMKYSFDKYPGNPNGSDFSVAGISSDDGRHLAMMPHPERSILPWQCPHYPLDRKNDEVTPWMQIFTNARDWLIENQET